MPLAKPRCFSQCVGGVIWLEMPATSNPLSQWYQELGKHSLVARTVHGLLFFKDLQFCAAKEGNASPNHQLMWVLSTVSESRLVIGHPTLALLVLEHDQFFVGTHCSLLQCPLFSISLAQGRRSARLFCVRNGRFCFVWWANPSSQRKTELCPTDGSGARP